MRFKKSRIDTGHRVYRQVCAETAKRLIYFGMANCMMKGRKWFSISKDPERKRTSIFFFSGLLYIEILPVQDTPTQDDSNDNIPRRVRMTSINQRASIEQRSPNRRMR